MASIVRKRHRENAQHRKKEAQRKGAGPSAGYGKLQTLTVPKLKGFYALRTYIEMYWKDQRVLGDFTILPVGGKKQIILHLFLLQNLQGFGECKSHSCFKY